MLFNPRRPSQMENFEIELPEPHESFYLSKIQHEDGSAVVSMLNDLNIAMQLVSPPFPYKAADFDFYHREIRAKEIIQSSDGKRYPAALAIRDRQKNGEMIGECGVHFEDGLPALGYFLSSEYHGRGLMGAAMSAFLRTMAPIAKWRKVRGGAFETNRASQRVMEKLGFVRIGQRMRAIGPERGGGERVELVYLLELEHD